MDAPVARRAVTGNTLAVDLTQPGHGPMAVREARRRIADALGKPVALVRMLDAATNAVLQSGAVVSADIQVVIGVDPEAEQAAETRLLHATGARDMTTLMLRTNVAASGGLTALPESFGQLATLQGLDITGTAWGAGSRRRSRVCSPCPTTRMCGGVPTLHPPPTPQSQCWPCGVGI